MIYDYDAAVFIGRFQPFHNGHNAVIQEALKRALHVVVLVGSAYAARDIRNPFTFEERKAILRADLPDDRIIVKPIPDYPYDEGRWIARVQSTVQSVLPWQSGPRSIALIGHSKDHSSYYLKAFPTWDSIEVPNYQGIDATAIRNAILQENTGKDANFLLTMPKKSYNMMNEIMTTKADIFHSLHDQYRIIKAYRDSWKIAPYPPTFVTVDAVVTQSAHILLVKRKEQPGKGLWALPGGFLNQNETLLTGAIRELREETKLKVPVPVLKGSIKAENTFDYPNRSTRGRTITKAFHFDLGYDVQLPKIKGSDDAEKAIWQPYHKLERSEMFEDHFHIINHFLNVG